MNGPDIRAWREHMGWTQERLAHALDPPTTQQTIARYEAGQRRVPPGFGLALRQLESPGLGAIARDEQGTPRLVVQTEHRLDLGQAAILLAMTRRPFPAAREDLLARLVVQARHHGGNPDPDLDADVALVFEYNRDAITEAGAVLLRAFPGLQVPLFED